MIIWYDSIWIQLILIMSFVVQVRGKDGVGAKMDHMELEREKGRFFLARCRLNPFAPEMDQRSIPKNVTHVQLRMFWGLELVLQCSPLKHFTDVICRLKKHHTSSMLKIKWAVDNWYALFKCFGGTIWGLQDWGDGIVNPLAVLACLGWPNVWDVQNSCALVRSEQTLLYKDQVFLTNPPR